MKIAEAKAIVDSGHVIACEYGRGVDDIAYVEMANDSTGYLGYTTWPGGFGSSRTHRSWDDTVRSLGPLALRDDWQAMTEDQERGDDRPAPRRRHRGAG